MQTTADAGPNALHKSQHSVIGGYDSLDSAMCVQGMVEAGAEGVQGLQRQVAALQQSSEEGLRRQGADLGDRLQELHHHYHRQQDLLQVPPPLLQPPLFIPIDPILCSSCLP